MLVEDVLQPAQQYVVEARASGAHMAVEMDWHLVEVSSRLQRIRRNLPGTLLQEVNATVRMRPM